MSLVTLGLLVGLLFGIWNMAQTWWDPLAEDTLLALLNFYGPMFAVWGFSGYRAARQRGRLREGIKAGAIVAFVSFAVFSVSNLIRVNVFLTDITGRVDWQDMMARFQASSFDSLRAFVNYEYLMGAWFKILVASAIGAVTGLVGGFCASLDSRAPALRT